MIRTCKFCERPSDTVIAEGAPCESCRTSAVLKKRLDQLAGAGLDEDKVADFGRLVGCGETEERALLRVLADSAWDLRTDALQAGEALRQLRAFAATVRRASEIFAAPRLR